MRLRARLGMVLLVCAVNAFGQQAEKSTLKGKEKDIDPLALQVLKAATAPIQQAKSYSFRALVSREQEGTNGQMITLFHLTEVTVQRPDKLHVNFHRDGKDVELLYNAGQSVIYSPNAKLYTTISTPKDIDGTLEALEKRDVFVPIRNFLQSDPYGSLTDDLTSGYVIGKSTLMDETVHQLAFTEPDAEWQLWVVGGDKPVIRRMEVIDKSKPNHPRIVVQFIDWNLNATPDKDAFTFNKPEGAKEIQLLKESAQK